MRSALTVVLVLAASAAAAQPQSLVDQFEKRTITSHGLTIGYRLFVPEGYDPSVSYPLVFAFHGSGERGSDNERHISIHRLATAWADPAVQAEHPAFVLAPQAPTTTSWTSLSSPDTSPWMPVELAALDALAEVEAEFNIDADRIYIVGLSLGGHATWDIISRLPYRFAAAVPMSGRGFSSEAADLLHLPIWAFTGETDTTVPPSETRRVIQAMEDLGRDVLYTHCRRGPVSARAYDCSGFADGDSLAAAFDAHMDLVYRSEATVGHGPWAPWFDSPYLHDWLFSKVRQDVDAIAITSPVSGTRWSGTQAVTWTTTRSTADTVEVWLNPAADPTGWRKLGEVPIADGSFSIDTGILADAALARVRLWVRNAEGRIAGRATSAPFALDNAGDAAPEVRLDTEGLRFDPRVTTPSYTLTLTVSDPEGQALTADVFYSTDDGQTYTLVTSAAFTASADPQTIPLDVERLPNASRARLRVDLTDGTSTVSEETVSFLKRTPRTVNTFVEHVEGEGDGSIELHFVDPDALTGHRYRIAIDDVNPEAKTYAVLDLSTSEVVLRDVPFSDGTLESPVFDGMALVVEDLAEGRADLEQTGWVSGDTDLGVRINGGAIRISILTIPLLATETTYELEVTEGVVGRSTAVYNIAATDLRFSVTSASWGAVDVAFRDVNGDGYPSAGDVLYLLEPNGEGGWSFAWELRFSGGTEPTEPGDRFRFVPIRSLHAGDVFEFEARVNTAAADGPSAGLALDAYPNPFVSALTVVYRLGAPADVRIEAFDALGRLVATLAEGPAEAAGRLTWDAPNLAPGVYVVRLTARGPGGAVGAVRQSVVHVGR